DTRLLAVRREHTDVDPFTGHAPIFAGGKARGDERHDARLTGATANNRVELADVRREAGEDAAPSGPTWFPKLREQRHELDECHLFASTTAARTASSGSTRLALRSRPRTCASRVSRSNAARYAVYRARALPFPVTGPPRSPSRMNIAVRNN